jgi:ligand-binding SRPBCC domain-containing protein
MPSGAESYPAQYQATRQFPSEVKTEALRAALRDGDKDPSYVVPVTEEDVRAMEQKKRMLEQVRFDDWITRRYQPWGDPAKCKWLQEIYPEYFEARRQENEAHHDIQKQFTDVMIRGPKSKEDLYLLFKTGEDQTVYDRVAGAIPVFKGPGEYKNKNVLYDAIMRRRDKVTMEPMLDKNADLTTMAGDGDWNYQSFHVGTEAVPMRR